ncbi:MAG: hypothetical protein SF172_05130 [Burkholderiales bacterium]|nr:hypothetical protein [Burkholderiales bacterium]
MKSVNKTPNAKAGQWGGLRYFVILAYAGPKSGQPANVGAYVSCWVNFPSEDGALVVAKHYIRDAGWLAKRVIEQKWVQLQDSKGKDSMQYYQEAVADGCSFVFHLYKRKAKLAKSKSRK